MNVKKSHSEDLDPAALVQSLSQKLKAYYVFAEMAEQISASLQHHLDRGDYINITDGAQLAELLSGHLQEVNQDRHLTVQWYPHPLPEQEGPLHEDPAWLETWHQTVRSDNYGLHKAERLPGNVGLLEIHEFCVASWGGNTAIAAMNFLANTQVLIIDLRKCRGGDPAMIALLSSYLFGEERIHLNSLYWREGNVTEQYWTLPHVPGERFGMKPVYLLLSKDTFSGGEEFAYNLQTRQRATLIGETTKGGAHPGAPYRFDRHFTVFIPNGRAINPITGTNWEGCGVIPEIQVPQEQAFKTAYSMALTSIVEKFGGATSEPFGPMVTEARATLQALESS